MNTKLFAFIMILLSASVTNAALQIDVATNKPFFQVGQAVTISITAYNSSETESLSLFFGTAKQATYLLDSIFDSSSIMQYAQIPSGVHIAPLTSHTWTFVHAGNASAAYPLEEGIHYVIGKIAGYGQSNPVEFAVVPEPAMLFLFSFGFLLMRRKG